MQIYEIFIIIKTRRVLNYIKTKAVYHLYMAFMISSL